MIWRQLKSLLALLIVTCTLASFLPSRGFAQVTGQALTDEEAVAILREYQIVRGDQSGDLGLANRLTRAQAAAIFVRAMNADGLSSALKESVAFQDAKGHWAAGEIAVAERLGLMRGDGNGRFRPDEDITYVEIMTVLLRLVGQEPPGQWDPVNIAARAQNLKIWPAGVEARGIAIRSKVFWALATTITAIPVDGQANLLRKVKDQTPPTLTLDAESLATTDATVTITGRAEGAFVVRVGGKQVTLDRTTGRFTGTADVLAGSNVIFVEAVDAAGNAVTKPVTVHRKANIAKLTISGPATMATNSTQFLKIDATDQAGRPLPLDDVEATLSAPLAEFDLATGRLVAGNRTGKLTLTLRAGTVRATYNVDILGPSSRGTGLRIVEINGGRSPALEKEYTVTVQVVDHANAIVIEDNFRKVDLTASGLSSITVVPSSAMTTKGLATFTVRSDKPGKGTLTASTAGFSPVSVDLEFLASPRVVLTATPKSLRPDDTSVTAIRATLMDDMGRAVNNTGATDVRITLSHAGTDGQMTDAILTIPRGKSNSTGDDGQFKAGIRAGTATIYGTTTTTPAYPVQILTLPVDEPLAAAKFDVTFTPAAPRPGDQVTATLRVLDSSNRVVTAGSYAFQLKLSTSTHAPSYGYPEGMTLRFRNSAYYPVDDGKAHTDPGNDPFSVVGRTNQGLAEFTFTYDRSGYVIITPVGISATTEAFHPTTGAGTGLSTTSLAVTPGRIAFTGTPVAVELAMDSLLGTEQPGGAFAGATTGQLKVKVVDANGFAIPGYAQTVTLRQVTGSAGVSGIDGVNRKVTADGVATFTITTSDREGLDLYEAVVGSMTSQPFPLTVAKTRAQAPKIVAIRGIKEGDLSPVTGVVGPDADYMDIQLEPQTSPIAGATAHWARIRVFYRGESSPFFTSQAINLAGSLPIVRIPKSLIRVGDNQFEVTADNGAGPSAKSNALDDVSRALNVVYHNSFTLGSATYDATARRLVINGSGLATNGIVDVSKFAIVKGNNRVTLDPAVVTVQTLATNSITLLLNDLGASVDPDVFHGSVQVVAESGWYMNNLRTQIAPARTVNVTPMAVITRAAFDPVLRRLHLYGAGFQQGSLNLALITLRDAGTGSVTLTTSGNTVTSTTDTEIIITLSQTQSTAVDALEGSGLYLTAATGWLRTGGSTGPAAGAITGTGHPLLVRILANSATYNRATNTLTISGSGLTGATLDPARLTFRRTTSATTWSPSSTGTVVAASATQIVVVFSDLDATAFEAQFAAGQNAILNTLSGWLVDAKGRAVQTLPTDSILFGVP